MSEQPTPNLPRVMLFSPDGRPPQDVPAPPPHDGGDPLPAEEYDVTLPTEPLDVIALRDWWMGVASAEIEPMLAKMAEYGGHGRAIDLVDIGNALTDSGVNWNIVSRHPAGEQAALQELGVYFYLVGKFARWKAAVAEGRPVSDDTLHDIGVYVRMAQRIRAVGGWPV